MCTSQPTTLSVGLHPCSCVPSEWRERPANQERRSTELEGPSGTRGRDFRRAVPLVRRWADLQPRLARYSCLRFSQDALGPLAGLPFSVGAARQILRRLDVLNRLVGARCEGGSYTAEGHRILQDHFVGDEAWFSDSSDTEKDQREVSREADFPPSRPRGRVSILFMARQGADSTSTNSFFLARPTHLRCLRRPEAHQALRTSACGAVPRRLARQTPDEVDRSLLLEAGGFPDRTRGSRSPPRQSSEGPTMPPRAHPTSRSRGRCLEFEVPGIAAGDLLRVPLSSAPAEMSISLSRSRM